MKLLKSKIFWVVVVLLVGGGSYLVFKPKPGTVYTTEKVQQGLLEQTVSVTGSVKGASEISLNFESMGTIAKINVIKGEQVTAGQVLAQLSAQAQQNAVSEALANLQASEAQLNKLVSGASSMDIKISEESLKNAEIAYQNRVNDLANLKNKLTADEKQYENSLQSAQVSLVNARDSALSTMSNELFDGEIALNRIKEILDRDDAKYTLGAKNSYSKTVAEISRTQAAGSVAAAKQKLNTAKISLTDTDISSALQEAISSLLEVSGALSDIYDVLINTPASTDYTQTEIDADKANIRTDQATISASISGVQTARSSWESARTAVATAANNLNSFLASKDSQVATAEGAVNSAKGAWDLSQAQHEQLLSPARSEDIDLQRARVAQSRAALQRAQVALDLMTIKAPVAGVITRVNYEVGEKADLAKPVLSLLGNSGLEIEVDIPESDIAKISVGQVAHITLDAFGEQKFAGHVTIIDPAETRIQDVVYYRLKVTFDQSDERIKPGMTANIDIATASVENALYIPARAVKENGGKYVEVLVNNEAIRKNVETGLRGDGGLIEILSGLSTGEEVITFKQEPK